MDKLKAVAIPQKANVVQKHVLQNPKMESRHVSDLDYDMLVTHVENTINRDKENQHVGFTPQELMLRSNPGLFSCENPTSGDLTNPREMYTILSNKTKSIEDLEAKFKKELVKSVQSSGSFPKLSRALSMNDLDHKQGKGCKASENIHRRLNMLVLNRHNTSLVEGLRRVEETDAENVRAVNFPHIESQVNGKEVNQKTKETCKQDKDELPTLATTSGNVPKTIDAKQTNNGDSKHDVSNNNKPHVSFSDTKLEKWFSKMPSEVFDKAQRALMEESVQDRLQEFKRKRSRKANFPNPNFNVCIGSKHQKVPNTYLELRVDSFGRHLQTETDDKRNRYRLHQKSMHNLKMREGTELDAHERIHREDTFPRLTANKSKKPSMFAKQKNKSELDVSTKKPKKDIVKLSTDGRLKTLYINERFDKDIEQRYNQKHVINNYEDYTERLIATKEMQYHDLLKTIMHSPISQFDIDDMHIDFERENTKATIVNLELKKETQHLRTPFHLEKSLKEVCKHDDTLPNGTEVTEAAVKETEENTETSKQQELTHDKIITKIPTAQSTRTSESRSSTCSLLSKEAMKKFNKLEVFAEGQRPVGGNTSLGNATESVLRHLGHSNTAFPSSYRLDTRNQQRHVQQEMETENSLNEIRKPEPPDVVFRFEPGEVFVSRKNPNRTLPQTVFSDRARVIYGKAVNSPMGKKGNMKKQVNKKEVTKDSNSSFYRAEVRKYESRALDDCKTDITPRHDNETKPLLIVTSTGLQEPNQREQGLTKGQRNTLNTDTSNKTISNKRDVATETDIIGSPTAAQLDTHLLTAPLSDRSASGLTDFIIDNNDGESLESDSDSKDASEDNRPVSNCSV